MTARGAGEVAASWRTSRRVSRFPRPRPRVARGHRRLDGCASGRLRGHGRAVPIGRDRQQSGSDGRSSVARYPWIVLQDQEGGRVPRSTREMAGRSDAPWTRGRPILRAAARSDWRHPHSQPRADHRRRRTPIGADPVDVQPGIDASLQSDRVRSRDGRSSHRHSTLRGHTSCPFYAAMPSQSQLGHLLHRRDVARRHSPRGAHRDESHRLSMATSRRRPWLCARQCSVNGAPHLKWSAASRPLTVSPPITKS